MKARDCLGNSAAGMVVEESSAAPRSFSAVGEFRKRCLQAAVRGKQGQTLNRFCISVTIHIGLDLMGAYVTARYLASGLAFCMHALRA